MCPSAARVSVSFNNTRGTAANRDSSSSPASICSISICALLCMHVTGGLRRSGDCKDRADCISDRCSRSRRGGDLRLVCAERRASSRKPDDPSGSARGVRWVGQPGAEDPAEHYRRAGTILLVVLPLSRSLRWQGAGGARLQPSTSGLQGFRNDCPAAGILSLLAHQKGRGRTLGSALRSSALS